MIEVPLQAIDNLLRPFHMGHVLIGVAALAILGSLPLKSAKVLGLNVILVGAIFVLLPTSMVNESVVYRLVGIGMIIVGPMIYATANR